MDPLKSPSPSPSPQKQPHQDIDTNTDQNDTKDSSINAMDNFKALVCKLAVAAASAKAKSRWTPTQSLLLQQRLNDFIPHFHTPDHPPYAAMVQTAIAKLSDKGGLSEEAISEFIKEHYKDLPWAHDTLLKHHLGELCKHRYIVETRDGCYVCGDTWTIINHIPSCSPSPSSSDILGLSSSSISDSSSTSSSSTGAYLERKWSKEHGRKRRKGRKRSMERRETHRTKASVRRQGGASKKDDVREKFPFEARVNKEQSMLAATLQLKEPDEFQEEQEQVKSEQNGSYEESGEVDIKISFEPHEKGQASQKQGRTNCLVHDECVKGKEILEMVTMAPGLERGGTQRKLVFEEMQTLTEDMQTIQVEDPITGDKTDTAGVIEGQNEVTEEQKNVPGKQVDLIEQNQAEEANNIIGTVPRDYGPKTKEELVEGQKQGIIVYDDWSRDPMVGEWNHLMHVLDVSVGQNKSLQLQQDESTENKRVQGQEADNANQQDVQTKGQIAATSQQNFPGDDYKGLKKRRGRPPKSSGRGKEIQKKRSRVPGRKQGRPRKNDVLKEEIQINVEESEAIEVHNINVDKITGVTGENEPKQWVNGEHNRGQGNQFECIGQNLAGNINVEIDTELYEQEGMVCEKWNDQNELGKVVSAVHSQSEVIEEQTKPVKHIVQVIDKPTELEEQNDLIVQESLLEGQYIVEEWNQLKKEHELHEKAEVARKQNPWKEQNYFMVEENTANQWSDAENEKREVGRNEISEERNECGQQPMIIVSQADDNIMTSIDCDQAKIPSVSSGSLAEKRNKFLKENRKQQGTVFSENEENCGTLSKQKWQLLGISSGVQSSDLQARKELLEMQLPEKMTADGSESQEVGFRTPKFEPGGGINAAGRLSSHILAGELHQLEMLGEKILPVLEAATVNTEKWSMEDYQCEDQLQLSQNTNQEPSSMRAAATLEELLPSENQKGSLHQEKVQSENQGKERPPKLRRSSRLAERHSE